MFRALIAALKPLANCLCPRCLTAKSEVSDAGSVADKERRESKRRMDNGTVHSKIQRARALVFKGYSLNSKRVKELLDSQSLNPIRVCCSSLFAGLTVTLLLTNRTIECFLYSTV